MRPTHAGEACIGLVETGAREMRAGEGTYFRTDGAKSIETKRAELAR